MILEVLGYLGSRWEWQQSSFLLYQFSPSAKAKGKQKWKEARLGLCICGSTFMSHEFSRILTTHTTHTGLFFVVCLEVRAGDGSTKTKKPKKPKTILKALCVCNIVRQYFLIRDTTICSKTSIWSLLFQHCNCDVASGPHSPMTQLKAAKALVTDTECLKWSNHNCRCKRWTSNDRCVMSISGMWFCDVFLR